MHGVYKFLTLIMSTVYLAMSEYANFPHTPIINPCEGCFPRSSNPGNNPSPRVSVSL